MEPEKKEKRPLWRRILRGMGITAAVLIAVGVLVWSIWNYTATKSLRNELAKIRAAGEPLTFKELKEGLPEINEEENAGRYYAAALELQIRKAISEVFSDDFYEYLRVPDDQKDKTVLEKVGRILEANRDVLELLDRAASMPQQDWDNGIEYGMAVLMRRLSHIRSLAKMLSMRCKYLIINGDSDGAVNSIISALKMAGSQKRQSILIVYLTRVGCVALACSDIQYVLENSRPSEAVLTKLQQVLLEHDQPQALVRVMMAERVYANSLMINIMPDDIKQQLRKDGSMVNLQGGWPVNIGGSPVMRQMAAGYLRDMTEFIKVMRKPWPEIYHASKKYASQDKSLFGGLQDRSLFGCLLAPALAKTVVQHGSCMALVRWARAAIAVHRYQRDNGKVPDTLQDLVPKYINAVPQDPFSGKEMLYKHDQNGYVIYSIGENLKDDGGETEQREDVGHWINFP
jgi:L-rhamnose mutarotase